MIQNTVANTVVSGNFYSVDEGEILQKNCKYYELQRISYRAGTQRERL
jgi:hypothetical protein